MSQQRVVEYQSISNFLRASHQFYVFIKQTSHYHHFFFSFFRRVAVFSSTFERKEIANSFFSFFFYFEYHCFLFLDFLQLFSLIDIIIRRDRDRRCVRIALSVRFRCDNVRCQSRLAEKSNKVGFF